MYISSKVQSVSCQPQLAHEADFEADRNAAEKATVAQPMFEDGYLLAMPETREQKFICFAGSWQRCVNAHKEHLSEVRKANEQRRNYQPDPHYLDVMEAWRHVSRVHFAADALALVTRGSMTVVKRLYGGCVRSRGEFPNKLQPPQPTQRVVVVCL